MSTKRDSLQENRESLKNAQKKAAFDREKVEVEVHADEEKLGEEVRRHRRNYK